MPASSVNSEDVLHGQRRLVHHAAHLREDRFDVDRRHFREPPHELQQDAALFARDVHAGDVRAGGVVERAGREHHEEVRPERVPLHLAEARDLRVDDLAGDVVGELVADLRARATAPARSRPRRAARRRRPGATTRRRRSCCPPASSAPRSGSLRAREVAAALALRVQMRRPACR